MSQRGESAAHAGDGRFVALDSWRGVCALLVALYHLRIEAFVATNELVRGSYLFVDFFFVLSGFIISSVYRDRVATRSGVVEFLLKRVGRLWPVHLVTLAAMLSLMLAMSLARHWRSSAPFEAPASVERLIANLLLMNGWGIPGFTSINFPSWTISCELLVYALFALITFRWGRSSAAWLTMAAASAAILFFWSPRFMDVTDVLGVARCAYGFGLGVVANAVFRFWNRKGLRWATGFEWLALAGTFAFVTLAHDSGASLLAPAVFFVVVLVFAFEAGAVSALARSPVLKSLGTLSFTIYMCHYVVYFGVYQVAWMLRRVGPNGIDTSGNLVGLVVAAGYLGAVVLTASCLHRWVEEPWRRRFYAAAQRCAGRFAPKTEKGRASAGRSG